VTGLLRVTLACLAVSAAVPGLQATFSPTAFYEGFPFGRAWVELLPPYNEHLVRDVGGFYLAFAILFAWAAVTLSSALIVPLCVTWTVAAVLHAYFHATHLDGFSTGDAIAQTTGLVAVIALPLLAIAATRRGSEPATRRAGRRRPAGRSHQS